MVKIKNIFINEIYGVFKIFDSFEGFIQCGLYNIYDSRSKMFPRSCNVDQKKWETPMRKINVTCLIFIKKCLWSVLVKKQECAMCDAI